MNSHASARSAAPPLVAHVVFSFDYGGLENGLVNLINRMPEDAFRHCVIALSEATDFRDRLEKPAIRVYALRKRPGKDFGAYLRLYRLLRSLRPRVLHTRNIGTLDCVPVARLAGVSTCIHGEHGWDIHDPDGTKRKYRLLRKLIFPLVSHVITVSSELRQWLLRTVGIAEGQVTRICNGVDTSRFMSHNNTGCRTALGDRFTPECVIVGSVLRFMEIKDPMNLVEAFKSAHGKARSVGTQLGLVMIGDGPLRNASIEALNEAGLGGVAWLPGSRDDVPALMQSFDLFVLGSRREGISNTLLEAMASGLPLIATDTGGNSELVRPGENGSLVEPHDPEALAEEILRYALDAGMREQQGRRARALALEKYSLDAMVRSYQLVYENAIGGTRV
jgi:sugar transferase (PEP-CTERM/EpsH1 system associated)